MDERPPAPGPTQPAINSPISQGPATTGNPAVAPGAIPDALSLHNVVHAPSLIPDVLSLHNVVICAHTVALI
jgi:hypothetical protein